MCILCRCSGLIFSPSVFQTPFYSTSSQLASSCSPLIPVGCPVHVSLRFIYRSCSVTARQRTCPKVVSFVASVLALLPILILSARSAPPISYHRCWLIFFAPFSIIGITASSNQTNGELCANVNIKMWSCSPLPPELTVIAFVWCVGKDFNHIEPRTVLQNRSSHTDACIQSYTLA